MPWIINDLKGLLCCALLGYLLLAQTSCVQPVPLNFQTAYAQLASPLLSTYPNSTFGITMQYPATWNREDLDPLTGGIVRFSSPLENANDTYAENLEIHFVNLARGTTLEDYTLTLLQSYKSNVDNFTIISSNSSSLAGVPAHALVFTGSYGEFDYKALNMWSIIGSNALIVIYYAEPGKYLTYLPEISNMIDSINVQQALFGKPGLGGVYMVPSLGLEVQLPIGWTTLDTGTSNETMFKEAPPNQNPNSKDRVLFFGVSGGHRSLSSQFQSSSDSDFSCGTINSASIVKLNGIKALESELKCDYGMPMKKIKFYMVASQGASIFIGYGASSESLYQKYLTDFDTSIQELRLANATDLSDLNQYSNLFKLTTARNQFEINGTLHTLDFASNSQVSKFQLDQDAKKLSFSVESSNKTGGETFIAITNLMQGPYVVSIDGKVSDDGVLVINDTTNQIYISLIYSQGKHNVVIVGSNVVPEYPGAILVLVCALGLAAVILVKRTDWLADNRHQARKSLAITTDDVV